MKDNQIHPEKPWPDPPERETATMKAMTAEERLSMMRAFASGALASFADEAYKAVALLRELESVIDWPPEGGGGIDHDDVDAKHSCPVFFASPNCRACAALSHLREYLGGKRLEMGAPK